MRVHVNPARRNHQPRGIDLAPGRSLLAADPGDPAFGNGNVAAKSGLAGAIHDRAATNNDVVHANLPDGSRRRGRAEPVCVLPCSDTTSSSTTREVGAVLHF